MQGLRPNSGYSRFRLFGTVGSPYALKLRSLLRYRRIPFDWIPASLDWVPEGLTRPPASHAAREEIGHIRPPVIPVMYFPQDGSYRNDSTFIAYELEKIWHERSVIPTDAGLALVSHIIEDMADEWGVKIAFQYRWANGTDRVHKSRIVTGELLGGGFDERTQLSAAAHFAARQVGRMPLVGCTPENAPVIGETFRRLLAITARLQQSSTFIFGSRPALADFGWYGQLESLATDPTSNKVMRDVAPATFTYLQFLEDASGVEGQWCSGSSELPDPVISFMCLAGEAYLPFLHANSDALARGKETVSLSLFGLPFKQQPFKYQGKCFGWLREEFFNLPGEAKERITPILRKTGCLDFLDEAINA